MTKQVIPAPPTPRSSFVQIFYEFQED